MICGANSVLHADQWNCSEYSEYSESDNEQDNSVFLQTPLSGSEGPASTSNVNMASGKMNSPD